MTLDEWLTLAGWTNEDAAKEMNRLRKKLLTKEQQANLRLATMDLLSRIRHRRRPVREEEIALIEAMTDRQVSRRECLLPPAPRATPGNHRNAKHGIWIVYRGETPMAETASLTRNAAWKVAGLRPPVDAVKAKAEHDLTCRLISKGTVKRRRMPADAR